MGYVGASIGVGILHFCGTFMLGFLTGTTASGNKPLVLLNKVLTFPLSALKGPDNLPPLVGWGAWGALSLAWGFGLCYLGRLLMGGTK